MDTKDTDQSNVTSLENEKTKRTITVPDEDVHQLSFTAVPNEIIDDADIIPRAKLLMVYLLKHAGIPGWQYHDSAMQIFLGCGRDNLEAAFKSLRQAGYVTTIITYDKKGRVCGSKRIFARTPKYLELNKSRLKIVPKAMNDGDSLEALKSRESTINRGPENQGTLNQGTLAQGILKRKTVKNKNIKKQQTRAASIQPKPEPQKQLHQVDPNVVVTLVEKLKGLAIAEVLVRSWLKKYGAEYVMKKVELTLLAERNNPAGFLNKAITQNWKEHMPNEPKQEKKAVEMHCPNHSENLTWYATLSNEEKHKCYEYALSKHAHFGNMLKTENVDILSVEFLKTTWFKMMMSLLGRSK